MFPLNHMSLEMEIVLDCTGSLVGDYFLFGLPLLAVFLLLKTTVKAFNHLNKFSSV